MLGQEQPGLNLGQVQLMIGELESLLKKAQQGSKQQDQQLRMTNFSVRDLQATTLKMNQEAEELMTKLKGAKDQVEKKQKASIWQRYWMVFLMGIIATLITNLIWFMKT